MAMNLHATSVPYQKDQFEDTYLLSLRNVMSRDEYTEILTHLNSLATPFAQKFDSSMWLIFGPMAFIFGSFFVAIAADVSPDFFAASFGVGFISLFVGTVVFAIMKYRRVSRARNEIQNYIRTLNEDISPRGVQLRLLEHSVVTHNDGRHEHGRASVLTLEVTVDLSTGGGAFSRESSHVEGGSNVAGPSAPPPYAMASVGVEVDGEEDTQRLLPVTEKGGARF
eukprot:comp23642_c0_seq1/m.40338 comp23642_c0_seq1/g.40338  ORF comp23642_c0_seq1/g.40338 comp23642_c0_seq1/m.40338 type:complete len:224 (-) comp23642_c0_seq1:704-1375(-)